MTRVLIDRALLERLEWAGVHGVECQVCGHLEALTHRDDCPLAAALLQPDHVCECVTCAVRAGTAQTVCGHCDGTKRITFEDDSYTECVFCEEKP